MIANFLHSCCYAASSKGNCITFVHISLWQFTCRRFTTDLCISLTSSEIPRLAVCESELRLTQQDNLFPALVHSIITAVLIDSVLAQASHSRSPCNY